MAKSRISDKEFWTILKENGGLYARTARAIRHQFNIEYSRQAVANRAEKKPDKLKEIHEENIDVAEEGLFTLMRSSTESIKLRSIELFLKTKGKHRGYIEKTEHDHTSNGKGFFDFLKETSIEEPDTENE